MSRRKLLWISLVFLLGAVSVLGGRPPRARANVTLISFTATSLNGLPEVFVKWETATEIGTAGFYVQRSLTNVADSYTNVSPFIPSEVAGVTGALYDWTDETTTLNTAYWYRLIEMPTDAAKPPIPYDDSVVWVMAGVAATSTPSAPSTSTATSTPTPTSTPTTTRTPTVTLTPRPGTTSTNTRAPTNPPAASPTRLLVTGATVTPRPATGNVSVPTTTSGRATQEPGVPLVQTQSPLDVTAIPGSLPSVPELTAPTPVVNLPAPSAGEVAAAPATPQLAPTLAAPGVEQPVVVVTEVAPTNKPAESRNGGLLLIIGAAVFLLGGAFLLLRQASK